MIRVLGNSGRCPGDHWNQSSYTHSAWNVKKRIAVFTQGDRLDGGGSLILVGTRLEATISFLVHYRVITATGPSKKRLFGRHPFLHVQP